MDADSAVHTTDAMTHSDLRIGCYVKLRDSGEIVRVERITRRKVGFFHGNDKSRGYFRKYSEIDGILIYDHWQDIERGIIEWDDKSEDEALYFYTPLGYNHRIRYIHELQNLHHALTGEELKIEL